MFGCGLPVCAASYRCIGEQVADRENGFVFKSASELAAQFVELFEGFPRESALLEHMRQQVDAANVISWEQSWEDIVLPVIEDRH